MRVLFAVLVALSVTAVSSGPQVAAQTNSTLATRVNLQSAERVSLTGQVDSNSPVLWERVFGRWTLYVITSINGAPSVAFGRSLTSLRDANPVSFRDGPPPGVWMEAAVKADDGTWYGFYHQEQVIPECNVPSKVLPRLGAARSRNRGRTWEDLGPVLEAAPGTTLCNTRNYYFFGGVGDFSVLLDHNSQFLYFFYTQYLERTGGVGVSMARMAWADRDEPTGKITVWNDGAWLPAVDVVTGETEEAEPEVVWMYPNATPTFVAKDRWDNGNSTVDVFWGPAVHWNTYLNRYVMLLNRASNYEWKQEGIYISYNDRIDNPRGWSEPAKILDGGRWYPQVIGLEEASGTDKEAGETARFYMSGTSHYLIRFSR